MKDINLINFKVENKSKKGRKVITAVVFLIIAGIITLYGTLMVMIDKNSKEISNTKKQESKYAEVKREKEEIRLYNERLKQMTEVLDSISSKSVLNVKLLKQISKAMPSNVYIVNYAMSKNGEINLVGKSDNNDSIAHFRYKLDESKEFGAIEVKTIKLDGLKNTKETENTSTTYTFDMCIKLKR